MRFLLTMGMFSMLLAGCGGGSSGTAGNDSQPRDSIAATAATILVVNH